MMRIAEIADVCKRAAIALGAGVLAFGIASAGAARAQSTGELSPGMLMERGWYAGAVPPISVVDGRRVVLASAPESEWIVRFGPFMNIAECGSAVSEYSRGGLPDSDYEALKMGHASMDDEARVLADVQARNVKCIVSDGSERFRMPGEFKADPTTDFVK
jgi:hypothetical protein